jgi:uncharacterized hydrophobic protein (TIGR00271 family)
MIHVRIVTPHDRAEQVLARLRESRSVCNVVHLPGVAVDPAGDLVLADLAREDASVVIDGLKDLGIPEDGAIALDDVQALLSKGAERAEEHARGAPGDAVVWEEVQSATQEATELSGAFLTFMVVAGLIAAVGIYLDSPILIVGAMVVGPEFGPVAGLCVALTTRRRDVAARSAVALLVGFPLAIAAVLVVTVIFKATGVTPERFDSSEHGLAHIISSPDFLAFFVASCAGVAGMLSLSTAKSGALIGVLISVTTIPAASNVGVSLAYGNGSALTGSLEQLGINLGAILLAGTATLTVQRVLFERRRRQALQARAQR